LFAVTLYGFIFYWLTAIVGPLFISFLVFPMTRQYFHSWFSVWIRFAFYRIAASCLVFLWSNVLVFVIDRFIGNDYSLRTVFGMATPFAMLNLAIIATAFRLPHWVDNLFSGSASAGHGGMIPAVVSRMF
jgi:type IV secretory pathway VirB6-like protein